jgi:molecular chaperone IbpA
MNTFTEFNRHFVGFDKLVDQLALASTKLPQNYPPYNIRKLSEDSYSIELAIAGFKPSEVEVELEDTLLLIKGKYATAPAASSYLYKGISSKAFTREFSLAENVEITKATMADGILTINLLRKKASKKATKVKVESGT